MTSVTSSPNMNLPVPVVGVETGPQWANDLDACLNIIDIHDHSPGFGVMITPAGININSALTFSNNNATALRSVRFQTQASPLALAADVGCVYESGVDLYYNDANGVQIRITQSGAVAGTPGSIANLVSPASASYVSANQTFVWQSAANTPANLDCASILLRNLVASSKALTLSPPAAMAANYTLVLPSLPASQKFMTLDASGNMAAPWAVDASTIVVSANTVQVPTGGITSTQLATNSVTTIKITDANVTTAKIATANITQVLKEIRTTGTTVAAGGVALSTSSGAFTSSAGSQTDVTNLSVTITTLGNPVFLTLISDGNTNSVLATSPTSGSQTNVASTFFIVRASTTLIGVKLNISGTTSTVLSTQVPPAALTHIDQVVAGTYTYKVQISNGASSTVNVTNCKLMAYEL